MKFSNLQKIIIAILVILTLCSLKNIIRVFKPQKMYIQTQIENFYKTNNHAFENPLPKEIKQVASDYKYFKDVFDSKENILIYGYTYGAFDDIQSETFHAKLNKLIEQEKINIKVVPIKNWRKIYKTKLTKRNFTESSACSLDDTKEKDYINNFESLVYACLKETCLINNKKNTYTTISRNPEFIIKTLKESKYIYKNTK